MATSAADAPLTVSTDGTAGPYVVVTSEQLGPVVEALRAGMPWRALLSGVLDLLALGLWLRMVRTRWRQLRALPAPPDAAGESTGIWGVGGPGVRVPGGTGNFRFDRRRAADDDTEGGTGP